MKENEGVCRICNLPTKFITFHKGYRSFCSAKCKAEGNKKYLLKNFGVENQFQRPEIKSKSKATIIKKYGVENISQHSDVKNKKIETLRKNYGVDNPHQSEEIKRRYQTTVQKTYGVLNPMFVKEIAEKAALNGGGRAKTKKYKTKFGDLINVQGTYEQKFVKYCEENEIRILNGLMIKYYYNNQQKRYFIDFQVFKDSKIILVEIKSSYWFNKFKDQVLIKKEAAAEFCIKNDMSYVLLIDKWSL